MSAPKRQKRASPRFDTLKIYQPVFLALVTLVEALGLGLTCRHDLPLQAYTLDQDLRIASKETAILRQAPENFDKSSYWAAIAPAISSCKHCVIVMLYTCFSVVAWPCGHRLLLVVARTRVDICLFLSLSLYRCPGLAVVGGQPSVRLTCTGGCQGTAGLRGWNARGREGYNFNWFNGRRGRRG